MKQAYLSAPRDHIQWAQGNRAAAATRDATEEGPDDRILAYARELSRIAGLLERCTREGFDGAGPVRAHALSKNTIHQDLAAAVAHFELIFSESEKSARRIQAAGEFRSILEEIHEAISRLTRSNSQLADAIKQLDSTTKLASVGAISLDLAHQIKNPLAVILGALEGLQGQVAAESRERRRLDAAFRAGWRIQELTESFMSVGQQERLEVGPVLADAMVSAGLPDQLRVETRWDCPDSLPMIEGNAVLIREVFSNIFSNAVDAMEECGLITVSASMVDGFVAVRISDDGPGISDEIATHLFEPFHTTKPQGHGLGLFAVRHIVEMYQGSVEVETAKGGGTSFIISLPAVILHDLER